ncbi:hypothetical protein H2200_010686 [Cladophialophora chaetospira]|uniref:MYND-type domain-containing protein n=1 Tax=Cladophialophora chaetospira TaxID=386627 RepID=A0AA38X0M8_9EURO|nr:hypothetical protein H2200_010686 [Cladophialophora chaetospira]
MADEDWDDTDSDATSVGPPECATCGKEATEKESLKRCGKCHETQYCSRECQKDDWKMHKRTCGKEPTNPFKDFLHTQPEQKVYELLIDCYRMQQEDDYVFSGDVDMDSLYGGAPDSRSPFRRFLKQAEKRKGLLLAWWSKEKAQECVKAGMRGGWSSLRHAIEKSDITEHYGNPLMPMQLRMLGSAIYRSEPGGF